MTFHDRAPGNYIACVDATADRVAYLGCAPVTVAPTPDQQSVVVPIAVIK